MRPGVLQKLFHYQIVYRKTKKVEKHWSVYYYILHCHWEGGGVQKYAFELLKYFNVKYMRVGGGHSLLGRFPSSLEFDWKHVDAANEVNFFIDNFFVKIFSWNIFFLRNFYLQICIVNYVSSGNRNRIINMWNWVRFIFK